MSTTVKKRRVPAGLPASRLDRLLSADNLDDNSLDQTFQYDSVGNLTLGSSPRTTKPAPGHKIFPYLLRNMTIERPNQVWAADITYVPIGRGSSTSWR